MAVSWRTEEAFFVLGVEDDGLPTDTDEKDVRNSQVAGAPSPGVLLPLRVTPLLGASSQ